MPLEDFIHGYELRMPCTLALSANVSTVFLRRA